MGKKKSSKEEQSADLTIVGNSRYTKKVRTLLQVTSAMAKLSTCVGTHVGAVLTDSNFCILSSGYNGVPSGFPHCEDTQTKFEHDHSFELHAETNCLARADNTHTSKNDHLMLFCTHLPCIHCAKLIVAGLPRLPIREIYISWIYNTKDPAGVKAHKVINFLHRAGITVWMDYKGKLIAFTGDTDAAFINQIENWQMSMEGWGRLIKNGLKNILGET